MLRQSKRDMISRQNQGNVPEKQCILNHARRAWRSLFFLVAPERIDFARRVGPAEAADNMLVRQELTHVRTVPQVVRAFAKDSEPPRRPGHAFFRPLPERAFFGLGFLFLCTCGKK